MKKYRIEWYGWNRHPSERTVEVWEGESKIDAVMRFHGEMRELAGEHYNYRQRPVVWSIEVV